MFTSPGPIQDLPILIGGITAIILGLGSFLVTPRWRRTHGQPFSLILLLGFTLLCTGALILRNSAYVLIFGLLACLWLLGWFSRTDLCTRISRGTTRLVRNHHIQAIALILMGFGTILGWNSWHEAQVPVWTESELGATIDEPISLDVLEETALTDQGTSVTLRTPAKLKEEFCSSTREAQIIQRSGLELKVIRSGDSKLSSNCHGWVFTGGRYWVGGSDVPTVLRENGYSEVSSPQVGDAIVYYGDDNRVVHTGIVQVLSEDGTILVESKWGQMGRFIHAPQDQTYSQNWNFYRSTRQGHLLKLPPPASEAPVSKTAI